MAKDLFIEVKGGE